MICYFRLAAPWIFFLPLHAAGYGGIFNIPSQEFNKIYCRKTIMVNEINIYYFW
jgi:hypothetical protein